MEESPDKITHFWQELKRRKVVRVITVYAAAAFVILELLSIIIEPLRMPDWTLQFAIVFLCIGFIIAVILSWIYDVTPGGIRKTGTEKKQDSRKATHERSRITGWKIATYASICIITGLIIFNLVNKKRSADLSNLEKTIAVLPFENLGLGDQTAALHDAIPIALSMELRNIEEFKVPSWRSTSKYKETKLKMNQIGTELNVNYLLLGSVQQQRRNVRVDLEFIHAASEEVIWSESREMVIDDIFQVQRDISAHVATALKANFTKEQENLTDDPEAYLAYLSGMGIYQSDETDEDFRLAQENFKEAVRLDPDFVQAYVKLSATHYWMYHLHYDRSAERLALAKEAFETARSLDPGNPDVLMVEGLYYYVTHAYDKALARYQEVEGKVIDDFELDLCLASLYRRQRDLDKATDYFLKAAEEDPQSRIPRRELGETYFLLRKYELAEKFFDQYIQMGGSLIEIGLMNKTSLYLLWREGTEESRSAFNTAISSSDNKTNPFFTHFSYQIDMIDGLYDNALSTLNQHNFEVLDDQFIYRPRDLYIAGVYWMQNNERRARLHYDSARIHLEDRIREAPEDSRYHSSLGIALAGLGKKDEAMKEGETAVNLMPLEKDYYRGIFLLEDLARIYTMVGEYDRALEQIDRLLSMPGILSVNILKKDPVWSPLWDLPEFQQLMEPYAGI